MDDLIKDIHETNQKFIDTQGFFTDSPEWEIGEPEANTPDGLIPNSYLDEQGVRHAMVFTEGLDSYLRLHKVEGQWKLNERSPF